MSQISRDLAPHTFRKPSNFAIAGLSEALAPLLRASAALFCSRKPSSPTKWRRGMLLGAAHIGDVLYNTASLKHLAEGLPECEWHFVASPPAAEVLKNNPYLRSCVPSVQSLSSVDVAICYNSHGYWRDLLAALTSGIPNRVGYSHKGFSALVTHPITIDYPQPFPAYFRDLVAQITGTERTWSLRSHAFPDPTDEAIAEAVWEELGLDNLRPVLACFITSRQSVGVWPAWKFAESLRLIERRTELQTALFGAPDDAPLLENVKAEFGLKARIGAGRVGLLPLICILGKCKAVFCTDSGPRHLANAAGTRVIYVRNIAFSKVEAGPYCDTEFDLAPDVEFVPPEEQERVFSLLDPAEIARRIISIVAGG